MMLALGFALFALIIVLLLIALFWYFRTPDEICPTCGDNNSLGSHGYYDCECGVVWYPRKKR